MSASLTNEQITAGAAVHCDHGQPIGRNAAIDVWDAMRAARQAAPARKRAAFEAWVAREHPAITPVWDDATQNYTGNWSRDTWAAWQEASAVPAQAAPTDAQIIAALHANGIDTYASKHGFDAVQVSATSVPNLRKVLETLAVQAPETAHADDCDHCENGYVYNANHTQRAPCRECTSAHAQQDAAPAADTAQADDERGSWVNEPPVPQWEKMREDAQQDVALRPLGYISTDARGMLEAGRPITVAVTTGPREGYHAIYAAPGKAAAANAGGLDDVLRDMMVIQEACGLHTDEYAPGSVIECIKELEADATNSARLDKFIDWYLREGKRAEINPDGHMTATTREMILAWLDAPKAADAGGQNG